MSLRRFLLALALIAAPLLTAPMTAQAAGGHWQTKAEDVGKAVTAAETTFLKGDVDGAKRAVTEAYFGHFEETKLEGAMRKHIGAKRAAEVEKMFATLRKAMAANDAAQVKAVAQGLRDAMNTDAKILDDAKVSPDVYEVNQ